MNAAFLITAAATLFVVEGAGAAALAAVRLLKSLGIRFEFGFMLLDPSSTFASVRANVGFLREIGGIHLVIQ